MSKAPCPSCGGTQDYSKGEFGPCSSRHHWYDQPPTDKAVEAEMVIDPSALEFYFEAVLPEIPEVTRLGMAAAIRRGVESSNLALLERIDKEVIGHDEAGAVNVMIAMEHATQRQTLTSIRKEYER